MAMPDCTHSQWVDISQKDLEFSVSYGARMRHVLGTLASPSDQFPSVAFFVGKRTKVLALRALFPENNITRRQSHGIANLHIASNAGSSSHPLLFADCTPGADVVNQIGTRTRCHEFKRFRLGSWATNSVARPSLVEQIQAQLLFVFTDVVCIFADDVGGRAAADDIIQRWARNRRLVEGGPKPRVLIVSQCSQGQLKTENCSFGGLSSVEAHFASLKVVYVPNSAYLSLRDVILSEIGESRQSRIASRLLFSASHLNAFFEAALQHFARAHKYPFSFIETARRGTTLNPDFPIHVGRFLDICSKSKISQKDVASFLAHAVILDSYPPESHREHAS
jgi:hypothetical protein